MLSDIPSRYLDWILALREAGPALDMTGSGLQTPLSLLEPPTDPDSWAPVAGGDGEIRRRLAERYRVPEAEVLPTQGTSLGLFLATASTVGAGDRVLVETPAYEALQRCVEAAGAEVVALVRRREAGWALDADEVLASCDGRTRMVAVSDLHNPTGCRAGAALPSLARRLEDRGIVLLVDEVYRDFVPGPLGTARALGSNVITVSSLTKVYGFGGLRAGWVFAAPERLRRMVNLLRLLQVIDPVPAVAWFRRALERAGAIRETSLARAARGAALFGDWLSLHPNLAVAPAAGGIHRWVLLPPGRSGTEVARTLLEEHGVAVVPGVMFGDDSGIRVGVGGAPDAILQGLEALGQVLDGS